MSGSRRDEAISTAHDGTVAEQPFGDLSLELFLLDERDVLVARGGVPLQYE